MFPKHDIKFCWHGEVNVKLRRPGAQNFLDFRYTLNEHLSPFSDESRKPLEMKSRNGHLALATELFSIGAVLASLSNSPLVHGAQPATLEVRHPDAVPADFRGCESARTCRFRIESPTPLTESLHVVRPNGVLVGDGDANAMRNRLNFLMSNMIHQHKRIELQELRKLDDGTYAATVKVNGMDVSADPILNDLMETSVNQNLSF